MIHKKSAIYQLNNVIVLVYPYFKTEENIHQKLFNPLGIALLSSILKIKGIKVVKIDCTFKSFQEVVEEIVKLKPKIIGFYTMISFTKNIYLLVNQLKSILSESLYICGGPLATLFPNLFTKDFDVIFKGEIDDNFSNFVLSYFKSTLTPDNYVRRTDLSHIPGIYVDKADFSYENEQIHLSDEKFKSLPLPDREGFDHMFYQKFWQEKEGIKATNIMTTVGCPFSCDFCSKPIFGNSFRIRNIEDIISEIKSIITYGYNYLWIADDCLTLNTNFLETFCDSLIEEKIEVKWSCLSRVDTLDINILKKMKSSGCEKVYLGLESGDNEVLKLMKKNLTVEQGKKAVQLLKKAGIKTAGFFIVGYPGETWDTINKTFEYARDLDLDEVSFNVPYPLPGSALFKKISNINFNKDWIIENEITFVFKSLFDENIIRRKIDEFYRHTNQLQLLNK
jgi:anaerobic magnesium-protoporphyrin IX monomethyl ester cyclase